MHFRIYNKDIQNPKVTYERSPATAFTATDHDRCRFYQRQQPSHPLA